MDELDSIFALLWCILGLLLAAIPVGTILWRRFKMSLTAELTAAVDAAVAKIAEQKNSTPDAEIQPQIDKLNNAVNPPAPTA